MMRYLLPLMLLLAVGCSAQTAPDAPRTEPTKFAIPDAVSTCGEVIQAAIENLTCNPAAGEICTLSAEYLPDDPTANLIGTVPGGLIGEVTTINNLAQSQTEGLVRWRSDVMNAAPDGDAVTLVVSDGVLLDNITPALDALTLETATVTTCDDAPIPVLLVQAAANEVNIGVNGVQITVGATTAVTAVADDVMTVYTLQGLSVVSAAGVTRVVREGNQITVPLAALSADGEPAPAVTTTGSLISDLPLDVLPLPVAPGDVPRTTQLEQIQDGTCVPNPTWQGEYTVQRGDNLTIIAKLYDLSYQELQTGNCLQNPSRIRPGLTLRVPAPTPVPAPTRAATLIPLTTQAAPDSQQANGLVVPANATVVIVPAFSESSADSPLTVDATEPIVQGACTVVRWSVANATQVFFDEQSVPAQGSRQICPQITTVVTLRVVFNDGTEQSFTQAVLVRSR